LLVQLKRGAKVARFLKDYRVRVLQQSGSSGALRVAATQNATSTLARMQRDARVVTAEFNFVGAVAEDDVQWTTAFDGGGGEAVYATQEAIGQVNFNRAGTLGDGSGVIVAVLDTGISLRHPALAGKVLPGWNFLDNNGNTDDAPAGVDTDGNGTLDEAAGHGTMVAGLVSRFAPGARLLPVKVMNSDGQGTLWAAAQGIEYAVSRGARIINLSLGTSVNSGILARALQDAYAKGVLIVTTAGNGNTDRSQFPAHFSFTLSVTSLSADNTKAPFANWGSDVDLCAPGVDVVSTFWDGKYAAWSGTSFSAAMVSGEAALVLSRRPELRVDRLARLLIDTSKSVDDVNPEFRGKLGSSSHGLIDFDAAMTAAARGSR
ncbi:MAG TPA: S8 family serine peptidase, partial [Armatimonadota bacterium]|nr:S8 family serine peptidase [Armatimonadota bacterium]